MSLAAFMDLTSQHCVPCEGDVPKKTPAEADKQLAQVPKWRRDGDWIHRDVDCKDFMGCVDLIRDIADLAEDEGHHPDLHLTGYRNLRISLQTHAIGGLSDNDFILAAKVERILAK